MPGRTALSCGVAAGLLYVVMSLSIGLLWPGYSVTSQTISELSAIGAPTRVLWLATWIVVLAIVLLRPASSRIASPSLAR